MPISIHANSDEAAAAVADLVVQTVKEREDLLMVLAAGRSLMRSYSILGDAYHAGQVSFRRVTAFATDEYVGLHPHDRRGTRYFLRHNFYNDVDLPLDQTFAPRGNATDLESECKAYDYLIKARGGIDLAVLGVGYNGHIGFNEPGSSLKTKTRVVEFTESTLAALSDGQRFRNLSDTPTSALSVGMAQLIESKRTIITATGIGKAEVVHKMLDLKASNSTPASQLISNSKDVHIILDRSAASKLSTSIDVLNQELQKRS